MARDKERGSVGVIDTLSAGYTTVNQHPWILAIPVLVDLFFWLGPRLSLAPLVQKIAARIAVPMDLPAEMAQGYQDYRDGLLRAGESFNLFSLLAAHFPGIPSLMVARDGAGSVTTVADPWAALLLFLMLPLVGMWLASVYYTVVAQPVRGSEGAGGMWGRVWRTWGRLVLFLLFALGLGLLIGVPLMIVAAVAGAFNASLLGFLVAFISVIALWVQFYLFFVVDAMVISDVGPFKAIRNSVTVIRFNLGSTLGLVALILIISWGMPIVWDAVAQNEVGTAVAILGNAYIASGLAVASMTFYRDRFSALAQVRA